MRWIVPLLLAIAPTQASFAESADRLSYVLMTGDDGSTMMSGSLDEYDRARALRLGAAPLLFVRESAVAYVIRDPAILRRAEAIMEPQRELGRRQGELGREQARLAELAEPQFRALVAEAIRQGVAQRVD